MSSVAGDTLVWMELCTLRASPKSNVPLQTRLRYTTMHYDKVNMQVHHEGGYQEAAFWACRRWFLDRQVLRYLGVCRLLRRLSLEILRAVLLLLMCVAHLEQ